MKILKYSKYAIWGIMLISLASCQKQFLDLNPHDQLSTATFWKTQTDGELALTGVYNTLTASYFSMDNYPDWDSFSDNSWDYNDRLGAKEAMTQPINSQTGGMVTGFYGNTYGRIAVCNNFLDNIGTVQVAASQIDEWKAEVLFMRSFYYFYLTEFYGDVPLVLKSYTTNSPLLPKTPKAQVVAQILSDLNTAIANLPDQAYTDGHVIKGAAILLKAKILLYNQQYADAATAAEQVISSNKFTLYSDYQSIFETAGQGTDNKEIMFSVRYLSPNFENISGLEWGWWMSVLPFQNLVDEYECTDGKPITTSALYNPAKPYDNRDPRLNESICVPGSPYGFSLEAGNTNWSDRIQYIPTPLIYCIRKWHDRAQQSVDAANHCDNDVVLLRYADALLSYAEAQNEASGPDATVYSAVNQVRARSSMPALPVGLSQSDMRDRIRHERRVEFAFEGQRWLDLKRWSEADQKINAVGTSQSPVKYTFASNNYLWPLPQSEVDYYAAHNSKLQQNPGY